MPGCKPPSFVQPRTSFYLFQRSYLTAIPYHTSASYRAKQANFVVSFSFLVVPSHSNDCHLWFQHMVHPPTQSGLVVPEPSSCYTKIGPGAARETTQGGLHHQGWGMWANELKNLLPTMFYTHLDIFNNLKAFPIFIIYNSYSINLLRMPSYIIIFFTQMFWNFWNWLGNVSRSSITKYCLLRKKKLPIPKLLIHTKQCFNADFYILQSFGYQIIYLL